MNQIDIENYFNRLFDKRALVQLSEMSIFETEVSGEYSVFGKYLIVKTADGIDVLNLYRELIHSFGSMKNALCWCIYDKRGKYPSANRIMDLDRRLVGYKVNYDMHKKLFKKSKDSELKLIYLAKLNEDNIHKKQAQSEIDYFVRESYAWQQRQYGKTV
jgi:hypothetical protein